MRNILFFVLFLLLQKISEKRTEVGNNHVKIERFEKDKLIAEQIYLQTDTGLLADGFKKKYYSNGKLKQVLNYKMGILDSTALEYYEDGVLKIRMNFKDDLLDGFYFTYFRNGADFQKEHFYHDARVGSQYIFDSASNAISEYRLTLGGGYMDAKFFAKYKNGKIISRKGKTVFMPDNAIKTYTRKDTIDIDFLVANPPKTNCIVDVYTRDKHISVPKHLFDYLASNDLNFISLKYDCSKGSEKIKIISTISDSTKNSVLWRDTLYYNVNVR